MDTTERANTKDETEQYEEDERFSLNMFPTLQELSSYRIVFAMWYNYLEAKPNISHYTVGVQHDFDKLAEPLNIPQVIKNQLKNNLSNVCEELDEWAESLKIRSTNIGAKASGIRYLDPRNCLWLPNGKLNHQRNILKILTERELSEVEKFTILCEYCCEDEIKKFRLEFPSHWIEWVNMNQNLLLIYWIRYLRNELHEIPLQGYSTVDYLMAVTTCDEEHWPAFKYFWNRLSVVDQIALAAFELNTKRSRGFRVCSDTYRLQKRLLSTMSWYQQHCLLSQVADNIILNFLAYLESPQYVFWAWQHSKDVMTGEQFSEVVADVFDGGYFSYWDLENQLPILLKIWDTAPDHLKIYAASYVADKITRLLRFIRDDNLSLQMYKFLHKMLLVNDVDGRRNFTLKNAISLGASIYNPRVMSDILDLCLPNREDQVRYNETILHSFEFKEEIARGFRCFRDEYCDNVDLRITCYTTNEQHSREYKSDFLVSFDKLEREYFIFDPANWKIFSAYIDKTFPDPVEAEKLKKDFIMAFVRFSGNYWDRKVVFSKAFSRKVLHYWNDIDSFDEFTLFAEKIFAADELKMLKLTFLTSFQQVITVGYYWPFYDENYYRKFLMWCVDYDDEAFAQFKKNQIRAKLIFDGILNMLHREYTTPYYKFDPDFLTKLDDLLIWYFDGDVTKKTEYKKKRVRDYNNKGVIEVVESMHNFGDEDNMAVFLKWAFEGDEQAIRKFKKDNNIFLDSDENDTGEDR